MTFRWRKSSFSAGTQNCVEVADAGANVLLRDSKRPERGHLTLGAGAVAGLVEAAKQGALDQLA